ncbi:adenylate/guanylate cyclase domain-containing protein [Ramlibacter sp. AW1]|uniref:Adenylate/guanylate cyclase domain-containing protein n=1 Tax=Ramlibacter aurantiacus TaxID=2801330 RepID=A0A936ZK08_9BURK|nr:adenylate/guanylate cyclase domain-containing protein [Ramlibacter aurantiacus]MBL0421217.1 adenylate/guanylate cyclase domain-containing protein [Ramlibacter aurantiacus]
MLPLLLALLHASGTFEWTLLRQLDHILYDTRLRATMPRTTDASVVIVDVDEKSLAEVGRWPWGRHHMARLTDELFERQGAAVVGFDMIFAEPDESSGLGRLRELALGELRDEPRFARRLTQLENGLDYDGLFAQALRGRPAVLGYYFTDDSQGRASGVLPPPAMPAASLRGQPIAFTSWSGYGANIERLVAAAPMGGFINPVIDPDGVVRAVPLLAEYQGQYYEALSLAVFRVLMGLPEVEPVVAGGGGGSLEAVRLRLASRFIELPVALGVSALVPFRGPGGPQGGSFRYVSASDLLQGRLAPHSLDGKVVLVGTTAPGLKDLRATPVGETFPGVETHANLVSAFLDGRALVEPDYALGYDLLQLLVGGLLLALLLPVLSAAPAVLVSAAVLAAGAGLNFWLYASAGLVLPLAAFLAMALSAFALNMSYGYFVESRSKRGLAQLFGTYVPPELVHEMVKSPENYSMAAENRQLTVMFCDMRGFTRLSEQMEPKQLQALLNGVFNRLSAVIRGHQGTIDKYMGDCVMAFWGAPVEIPDHAALAVRCALAIGIAVDDINREHQAQGLPVIQVGIGLNTGIMCVGDMGSDVRRAYTVIGDEVNLGARLEGLSKRYGVPIVASDNTRRLAPGFTWQELDKVRVHGRASALTIHQPLAPGSEDDPEVVDELRAWQAFLRSWRAQNWESGELLLRGLAQRHGERPLYRFYAARLEARRPHGFDPAWDGATHFDGK